jgi:hypothetical protein
MGHVERSLHRLRAAGYCAVPVNSWPGLGTAILGILGCRKDFLMIVPCDATRLPCVIARATRCRELKQWLQAGGRFEAWGWSYTGHSGGGRSWQLVKRLVGFEDIARLERL